MQGSALAGVPCAADLASKEPESQSMWKRLALFSVVFAAACVLLFAELGTYPLFNPDEALYAEPAREMLETGQYITTLLNYVVRYTKPPLVIWAQALSFHVFGVNEFAARFVGAVAGALLVASTYLFAEKYLSRKTALLASFMLMTAPLYVGTGREAITDMPLSLFIGGSLMALFHSYEQRSGFWLWIGYGLIGLAVMTKGPVGLILPAAILGLYHILRKDFVRAIKAYKPWFGLLLVAAIAVPWFAVEIYLTKGAYYYEFLVRENFQRFTSVVDHRGAWWYHLAAVAGGFLPWSIFIPGTVISGTRSWLRPENRVQLFCVCTAVVVVGFFSSSVSKLLPYTVPAFPAVAMLLASYVNQALEKKSRIELVLPMVLFGLVSASALFAVPFIVPKLKEAPPELIMIAQSILCCFFAIFLAAAAATWFKRSGTGLAFAIVAVYLTFVGYGGRALNAVSQQWEGAIPEFSQFAAISDWPIFVYHMRKPSVPFYAHRQVIIPLNADELAVDLSQTNGAYIISKRADLAVLAKMPRCHVVASNGLFVLLAQKRDPAAGISKFKPLIRAL